jgi:hypothetical protein
MNTTERQNKAAGELFGCGNAVGNVGRKLQEVGMDKLANQLFRYAEEITKATEEMQAANFDDLKQQIKRNDEASANMLQAALAGIKISKGAGKNE